MLTPAEAARLANVSRKTIYREVEAAPYGPCTWVAGCCGSTRPTSAAGWKAKPNEACSGSYKGQRAGRFGGRSLSRGSA